MKSILLGGLLLFFLQSIASVEPLKPPGPDFYRNLTQKIRGSTEFMIPLPNGNTPIKYSFVFDQPVYQEPIISDTPLIGTQDEFFRSFYDRILFKDGSYLEVNGEKLPLTCVFIEGQDNRFSKSAHSPLIPEFVIKVTLVANDFSCQGPLRPGWPETGGRPETWDTYISYQIKDPTIMLPVDARLRYRWNEYDIVLVDRGQK